MSSNLPFRQVRELAEERAGVLEFESGMSRAEAEAAAIAWAQEAHGVTLRIVENAEQQLPLSRLCGRVFWPVVTRPDKPLTSDEILEALEIAALRARKQHEAKLTDSQATIFEERYLAALIAQHGISVT